MKAELVLKSAERQETYPLTSDRVTLGRSINTHVRLMDKMASREHCEILRMGDRFVLRDLGSSNGTFINGKSLSEKVLEWGDKITIGETVLIFFQDSTGSEGETEVSVSGQISDDTKSFFLPAADVDVCAASEGEEAGEYAHLMYEVGTALLPKRNAAEVCHTLIKTVLQGRRFGRAAVVLFDERGEVAERFTRLESGGSKHRINLEAGILRRVFADRECVYRRTEQVEDMIFSSMIVPIGGKERALGALYVDDLAAFASLKQSELHLLAALGRLVGHVLENLRDAQRLRLEKDSLRHFIASENDIIGDSKAVQKVSDLVAKVAPTEATVLIRGECGVGKELVARAIHLNGPRGEGGPWVAVNCAAVAQELLASELFGHERGAFAGATARRKGRFEAAHGGTLFLDDVDELPMESQLRLLRALDERTILRLGGAEEIPVDVRVIAATRRDLSEAVARGAFRQELFYRLSVFEIAIPPLRERRDDIVVLADHFLEVFARKMGKRAKGFREDAKLLLREYDWPGNVRELKNVLERALLLSDRPELTPDDFPSLRPPRVVPKGDQLGTTD